MQEAPAPSRWKSPWLWIGLSCGVLVLGIGSLVALSVYVVHKSYREARGRVPEERALMSAEVMARHDPDVAVVSRDFKGHTVTLRNRRTGERFVLGQIGPDKLSIQTGAGQVVAQLAHDRRARLLLGSAAGPPPDWIPIAPGMRLRPVYAVHDKDFDSGGILLALPAKEALASCREALSRGGFRVVPLGDSLHATSVDDRFSISMDPAAEDRRAGVVLTWYQLNGNR